MSMFGLLGAPFGLPALKARLFSADLRSLALLRWVLGTLLIVDLKDRFGLVDTLYSNEGVLSNHFSLFRPLAPFQFSLYVGPSSSREVIFAFAVTLLVYLLFTVGYRTRLFHVLSFVCVTSLHSRNLMAELPSDAPLHLWVGWSFFLPLGARFSIDAIRRSLIRGRDAVIADLNAGAEAPVAISSIAIFGMLLQLSAMHVFAAIRQGGPLWQDGTALYYALRQDLWVTDLGVWLGQNIPIADLRVASVTYRWLEILIGVLVLVPSSYARRACIALLLAFHLGSPALWNFGPYEWVMLGATPLLISGRDWDVTKVWYQRRKPGLGIWFDANSGLAVTVCRLLKRLDALGRFTFVAASSTEMLAVREATNRTSTRARALAAILRSLPLGSAFALILRIPGVSWLADRTLDFVAGRRIVIGAWLGLRTLEERRRTVPAVVFDDAAGRSIARALTVSREVAALLFIVVCGVALARDMNDESTPSGLEAGVYRIVAYPRLFQRWGIFAPDPPKRPGTLVAEAETASGARLDPFTGLPVQPPSTGGARRRPDPLLVSYFTSISQPS